MWQMVMFGVEIPASVGGFAVNYCGQCHPFPDEQNIRKGITLSDSCCHSKLNGRPLTIKVAEDIL
jgi:hypothetical protein